MAYPYYNELQRLVSDMNSGNFGLWYNKFIPLNGFDLCKASDGRGNDKNAVLYYFEKYNRIRKDPVNKLLDIKHLDQAGFCSVLSPKYEKLIFKAKLETPLITGIGETHPHEVSMVFDHNMGIPYIPASGVKGIVRFAHTLGLIDHADSSEYIKRDSKGEFIEESNEKTSIPDIFGGDLETEKDGKRKMEKLRGKVIFLDAYPEKMPDLHVDIMNPHYGKYYSDDKNETPPADYLDPNPLKFLTVSKDTIFIFRALVDKESPELIDKVKTAFKKALTEEGVGAKTAVGYGIFGDLKEEESESVIEFMKMEKGRKAQEANEAVARAEAERIASLSEDEKMIEEIANLQKDTSRISALVQECLAGNFESRVYVALRDRLSTLGEWKPDGSKQRKVKMKERNAKIEAKMNT